MLAADPFSDNFHRPARAITDFLKQNDFSRSQETRDFIGKREREKSIFNVSRRENPFLLLYAVAQPGLSSSSTPHANERYQSFDIKALFIPEKLHIVRQWISFRERSEWHTQSYDIKSDINYVINLRDVNETYPSIYINYIRAFER